MELRRQVFPATTAVRFLLALFAVLFATLDLGAPQLLWCGLAVVMDAAARIGADLDDLSTPPAVQ
jgi:hypothetical protein